MGSLVWMKVAAFTGVEKSYEARLRCTVCYQFDTTKSYVILLDGLYDY